MRYQSYGSVGNFKKKKRKVIITIIWLQGKVLLKRKIDPMMYCKLEYLANDLAKLLKLTRSFLTNRKNNFKCHSSSSITFSRIDF